jgi:predicted metal-binding protein
MREFECRGPLRSIATCSLRKDPVCYRASNGLMKSYINNCIACHTAAPSKNFTMGGGCYGTDFSMKAIILKMLEAERRMIESNMNVEMM